MPNVTSSLGTTQPYIPLVNATELGKAAGLAMHFASLTALNAAVVAERSNITDSSGIWTAGQPFTVATEPRDTSRVWFIGPNAAGSHARTVRLRPGLAVVLPADTNAVLATSGAPSGGTGADGDIAVDYAGNTYYLKVAGAWTAGGTIAAGGGAADLSTPYGAAGAQITTRNPAVVSSGIANVNVARSLTTIAAGAAFTIAFTGSPATDQWFGAELTNTSSNPITVTIPTAYSIARGVDLTSFVLLANATTFVQWRWDGARYVLYNEPLFANRIGSLASPVATDDQTKGYGPGSLWVMTSGAIYVCRSAATGAAVWASSVANLTGISSAGSATLTANAGDVTISAVGGGLQVFTDLAGIVLSAPGFSYDGSTVSAPTGTAAADTTIGLPYGEGGTHQGWFTVTADDGELIKFGKGGAIASASRGAFFGVTPVARPTTSGAAATFVAGSGTAINSASTFDGYTLAQVVRALRSLGLLT